MEAVIAAHVSNLKQSFMYRNPSLIASYSVLGYPNYLTLGPSLPIIEVGNKLARLMISQLKYNF